MTSALKIHTSLKTEQGPIAYDVKSKKNKSAILTARVKIGLSTTKQQAQNSAFRLWIEVKTLVHQSDFLLQLLRK